MITKNDAEHKKTYNQEYYQKNKEKLSERKKRRWREATPEQRDKYRMENRRYKWEIKKEVLTYYGNGTLACVYCGYTDIRALTLDHINNNGAQERKSRKELEWGGVPFYRWLRRNSYPKGYQTLCMNCQVIKKVVYPL